MPIPSENKKPTLMDKLVSLCKRRGFVFPDSEIYGGMANTWDFGPLGVELKNNIKRSWWKRMVYQREEVVGIDTAIIMNPKVWQASGHLQNFNDLLRECKSCHARFRQDYLEQGKYGKVTKKEGKIICPLCGGELTQPKRFNLLVKTFLGPVEDTAHQAFLRGETAQGIFVNFKNVLNSSRQQLPFGIAQIGKSFRNEITPGNFIFRTREFEQMELEYFVPPQKDDKWYHYWLKERLQWYLDLGIRKDNIRLHAHRKEDLAHYAKACTDVEYNFPFALSSPGEGWGELEGIANRTDYDLKKHQEFSGQDMTYFDATSQKSYFPFIIEPSVGVERSMLAFLIDAYAEENTAQGPRIVLHLHPSLSPVKVAVFPLLRNNKELVILAREVFKDLQNSFPAVYDSTGSIGRRYRRQDEIGTPWCITVDHQSLKDKTVTIRDRDTMQQTRVQIKDLREWLREKLNI